MKIVNTTPHPLTIYEGEEVVLEIPGADKPFRLEEKNRPAGSVQLWTDRWEAGPGANTRFVKVVEKSFVAEGDEDPFPVEAHVYYYVSFIVAQAFPTKRNLLFAGEVVRDQEGRVKGIKSFARLAR